MLSRSQALGWSMAYGFASVSWLGASVYLSNDRVFLAYHLAFLLISFGLAAPTIFQLLRPDREELPRPFISDRRKNSAR